MKALKFLFKKILPKRIISFYHFFEAYLATWRFGFPSKRLTVIGVTGTKGKSTTVYLLAKILKQAGFNVGWSSSMSFCVGNNKEISNPFHMTMPNPFHLQKTLAQMLKNGVKYAVLEVTSEGIKQYRHKGIKWNMAILTNLQPEHIEAHGGFENYKKAKLKLFQAVAKKAKQNYQNKKSASNEFFLVVNGDDKNSKDFLNFHNVSKWIFKNFRDSISDNSEMELKRLRKNFNVVYYDITKTDKNGSKFILQNNEFSQEISLNLAGEFNVVNALAASTAALALGIKLEDVKRALEKISYLPGRMEFINEGQDFTVIIDLAHTPDSFEAVFKTVAKLKKDSSKIITVFGAAGGGRDKWKRPVMGEIAAKNSDYIILTNEDPYDDPPDLIIQQIQDGISNVVNHNLQSKQKFQISNLFVIFDREEAIKKAILLAQKDDIVLLLGKGTESSMVFKNNRSIPWNEKKIVMKYLQKK